MKKTLTICIALLCYSTIALSQEETELGVFKSDTTWLSEIIKFPISFAPEINYEGYEDLRFDKNWRKPDNEGFWCYTFAWHITNSNNKQSVTQLETNIKLYYDGIMKAVNKKKNFEVPETTVLFIRSESKDYDFIGKIHVYDSFTTEDMITLNVGVKGYYCETKKRSTVVFRLSPQPFEHKIWNRFENEIALEDNLCEH